MKCAKKALSLGHKELQEPHRSSSTRRAVDCVQAVLVHDFVRVSVRMSRLQGLGFMFMGL